MSGLDSWPLASYPWILINSCWVLSGVSDCRALLLNFNQTEITRNWIEDYNLNKLLGVILVWRVSEATNSTYKRGENWVKVLLAWSRQLISYNQWVSREVFLVLVFVQFWYTFEGNILKKELNWILYDINYIMSLDYNEIRCYILQRSCCNGSR